MHDGIRLPLFALLASTFLFATNAEAACTFRAGYSLQTFNLVIPALSVSRDTAVGTVLATAKQPTVLGSFADCGAPGQAFYEFTGSAATTVANTAETTIPGIGLRFFFENGLGTSFRFSPTGSGGSESYAGTWGWNAYGPGSFGVQVVVTGTVGAGQFNGAVGATVKLDALQVDRINVGTFNVAARSCQTPNFTVNLGTHAHTELRTVGSSTSSTNFNIPLYNCPAGIGTIKYKVDAVTAILDADRAVVALNGSSTANGVGVQLLDGSGNVHPFGTTRTATGINAAGGNFTIPLRARYFRTGTGIGGGTANTSMTFTISYE